MTISYILTFICLSLPSKYTIFAIFQYCITWTTRTLQGRIELRLLRSMRYPLMSSYRNREKKSAEASMAHAVVVYPWPLYIMFRKPLDELKTSGKHTHFSCVAVQAKESHIKLLFEIRTEGNSSNASYRTSVLSTSPRTRRHLKKPMV